MANLNRKLDDPLQRILDNPSAILVKQRDLSTEATVLMLRQVRNLHGVMSRSDELDLSSKMTEAIRFIAEHNLLFYLALIERFDLIKKLFWNKDHSGQLQASMNALEKSKLEKYQQELYYAYEQNMAKQKQETQSLVSLEQKKNEEGMLINLSTYQYYCLQLQKIHHVYHEKQINVYSLAAAARMERIQNALQAVHNDPSISNQAKKQFSNLQRDYHQEIETIKQIPTTNPDGSINLQETARKHQEWQRVDEKYSQLFTSLLEQHPGNPKLQELLVEEKKAVLQCKQELAINKAAFEQEVAAITPHLENCRAVVKDDLNEQMQSITTLLESVNDTIPVDKQAAFAASLKELNSYQATLQQSNDDVQIQAASKKFQEQLQVITELVKPPIIEAKDYQQLKQSETLLTKANQTFAPIVLPQMSNVVAPSAPPPDSNYWKAQLQQVVIQRERVNILNEEQQQLLTAALKNIIDNCSTTRDLGDLSPEIERLINEADGLSEQIKSSVEGGVPSSKLESLLQKLDLLHQEHPDFQEPLSKLQELSEAAQPQSSLSLG